MQIIIFWKYQYRYRISIGRYEKTFIDILLDRPIWEKSLSVVPCAIGISNFVLARYGLYKLSVGFFQILMMLSIKLGPNLEILQKLAIIFPLNASFKKYSNAHRMGGS